MKPMHCHMCGKCVKKKNNFIHVLFHGFSWLCHACGKKLNDIRKHLQKALNQLSPLNHILDFYSTRDKVTLKWTDPIMSLSKGHLESNLWLTLCW